MYPNAIRKRKIYPKHLGEQWLNGYTDIIKRRVIAKKEGKKAVNEALKLALNGGSFGKLGEQYNWQFDLKAMHDVTIGSQIDLLMLIEKLESNGIHIISANTDGIVALFDSSLLETYYSLCKEWEVQVGNDTLGNLEYAEYSRLVQTSVNDYLAIDKKGKIKTKGDFISEYELHKNKSARIVGLALQSYFIKGESYSTFIRNHDNIFDFCLAHKSIGQNRLIALDKKKQLETPLQKIVRYFISNEGVHILKQLPALKKPKVVQMDIFGNLDDGRREQEIEAGYVSVIYNKHVPKQMEEYNLNYNYYEEKVRKIIDQVEKSIK